MKRMLLMSVIWTSLFLSITLAQTPVKITDSGELYSTFDLKGNEAYKKTIEQQVGKAMLADILANSSEDAWPSGIASLETRNANRPKIADYKVNKVAEFDNYVVLLVSVIGNKHMPAAMQPQHDIYFIMSTKGINGTSVDYAKPAIAEETSNDNATSLDDVPIVKIIDADELFSTYDLETDDEALEALSEYLDDDGIATLNDLCNESNWPSGINTLETRKKNQAKFKDYIGYYGAEFGEKIIIYVPREKNLHMPAEMLPPEGQDLYFVFNLKGVQVEEVKNK